MTNLPKQMTPDELASELYQFFREAQSLAESAARLMASVMAMPSTQPIHVQRFVEEATLREDILNFHVTEPVSYHETADRLRVSENTVRRIVEMARAAGDLRATYNPDTPGRSSLAASHTQGNHGSDASGQGKDDASWAESDQEHTGEALSATQDRNEPGSDAKPADPVLAGSVGEGAAEANPSSASRDHGMHDLPHGIRTRTRYGKTKFVVEINRKAVGKVSIGTFNTREEAVAARSTALHRLNKGRHPKTNEPLAYANAPVGTFSDIKAEQGAIEATFMTARDQGAALARATLKQDLSVGFTPKAGEEPQAPETSPGEEVAAAPEAKDEESSPHVDLSALSDDEILARLESGQLDLIALMEAEPARHTLLSEEDEEDRAPPHGHSSSPLLSDVLEKISKMDSPVTLRVEPISSPRMSPGKVLFVDEGKLSIEGPKGRVRLNDHGMLRVFRRMADGNLYDATTLAQIGGIKVVDLPGKLKSIKSSLALAGLHLDDSMRTLFSIRQI